MRLAVLITYYNEGQLVRECVDSVLSQPGTPDEVLVYDDASTDPPDRYLGEESRVRIVRGLQNRGPGAGRNALLRETSCEYVHFQDADDLFHPDWCREVRSAIAERQPDIVLTDIMSVREGRTVSERVLGVETLGSDGDLVRFGLRGSLLVPSTTFRRALAIEVGGFRPREVLAQSEDFDFHIRLAAAAKSVAVIPRSLIIQRLRSGSHSADMEACWTSAVRAIELLSETLPPQYRVDTADAAARVGSELYAIHAAVEARCAFRLARRIASPRYLHRSRGYRVVAKLFGPGLAEWVSTSYRRLVPERWRRGLAG